MQIRSCDYTNQVKVINPESDIPAQKQQSKEEQLEGGVGVADMETADNETKEKTVNMLVKEGEWQFTEFACMNSETMGSYSVRR